MRSATTPSRHGADERSPSSMSQAGRLRLRMHSSMFAAWFSSPLSTSSIFIAAERATSLSSLPLRVSGNTSKPWRLTSIVASLPWNSSP